VLGHYSPLAVLDWREGMEVQLEDVDVGQAVWKSCCGILTCDEMAVVG